MDDEKELSMFTQQIRYIYTNKQYTQSGMLLEQLKCLNQEENNW